MRVLTRALATLGLAALAGATSLSAQNGGVGSYRFYVGASGGVMDFATTAQTRGGVGMAGANMLVTGNRVGLLLAVDAGLGSGETAAFNDPVDGTIRTATFDHIMRYYFEMMGYPLKGNIQPFIGVGFGIQTLTNLQVQGSFTDDVTRQENYNRASDLASTAFAQAVAGVDIRVGVLDVFGSVSAATAASSSDLIQGAVYTGQAGIRFSLGKSREDVE